jgi:hypothetical protein
MFTQRDVKATSTALVLIPSAGMAVKGNGMLSLGRRITLDLTSGDWIRKIFWFYGYPFFLLTLSAVGEILKAHHILKKRHG